MGKKKARPKDVPDKCSKAPGKGPFIKGDYSKLDFLLVFIPISIALYFVYDDPLLVFVTAAIAIIPLAGLMGKATEEIALHTSQTTGGLLNATFGNATELIIALVAISNAAREPAMKETLFQVVKASLTGSIIGNLLLVAGLSMLAGGLKFKVQRFNIKAAQMASTVMTLAVIALLIPTMWNLFPEFPQDDTVMEDVSIAVALVMIVLYFLSLVFSFVTHKQVLNPGFDKLKAEHETVEKREQPKETAQWSKPFAVTVLVGTTALVALMSELLVGSIEGATHTLGLSELFVGVIIIAIIGNAAEHSTAILAAMKDKMDLSLGIASGSSAQIALLVTPILVFASLLIGSPMNLVFFPFEIIAIGVAVVTMNMVSMDGESNWFEGCELLGVYIILGVMFFFH